MDRPPLGYVCDGPGRGSQKPMRDTESRELADRLDQEADDLEQRSEELEHRTKEVAKAWAQKRADPKVPGAPPEDDDEGDDDDGWDDPDEEDDEDEDEDEDEDY